jgi:uncharacterized membrane protein YeaQ/YmgE (transglycosylase-associated protein family)
MGIISWILLGLVAGWLAGKIMKGRGFGVVGDIIVGIIGAFIGGFVGSMVLGWDVTGFNFGSIVLATLGAMVLIGILKAIPGKQPLD